MAISTRQIGYRYVPRPDAVLDAIRNHDTKAEADSTINQRIGATGGAPKRLLRRAALVRRPEGSAARGPEAEMPSEPLNTAGGAQTLARNQGPRRRKATIRPAPKRGPSARYDWPAFHDVLNQLISEKPGLSQADAVRAMSDWCAMNWGAEDGPGEPANSALRQHIAAHPGAPWAKTKGKARHKHLSGRAKTSARTST